ncbi:hypothetical protein [Streptomyces sp. S.PB5]|uniref:hypothetical protein n=1 Tax=Streptomyces sp. S.PB5 TaxID=3020844 RepID=UPI0025AF9B02|nr:hypothetical protein [Streptomyces sp. S.PB5]MDN3025072.1 hypothetical protein [Streptomyces sp. S.PB5]
MTDGGFTWGSEPEKELYKKAVRICLADGRLSELLEQRPAVTVEAVVEAMCSPSRVQAVTGGIPRASLTDYRTARRRNDWFRWALPEPLSPSNVRENKKFLPWIAGVLAFCAVTVALFFSSLPPYVVLGILLFLLFAPGLALARPSMPSPPAPDPGGGLRALRLALLGPVTLGLWLLERWRGAAWIDQVYFHGLHAEVVHTVEELIGDDLGTLLVTGSDEGLRSQHQMSYVVSSRSAWQLGSKIDQLADGTIAVSGPRGVGKTTLMRSAVRSRDFSVFAHAPAAYAPHEFLISLFVSVCREYITRAGHEAPELVRLSYLHRLRRTVVEPLRGLLRLLPYALPAALLVGLGLFAVTKESVESEHGVWGWPHVSDALERLGHFTQDVLQGRAPAAAFALALVGGFLWVLRHSRSFPRILGGFGRTAVEAMASGLIVVPLASLVFDPDIRDHFSSTGTGQVLPLFGLAALLLAAWLAAGYYHLESSFDPPRWHVGVWSVDWKWCLGLFTLLWPFLMLALIAANGTTSPLLTDDETPFRLGAILLGLLLRKLLRRSWSPPRLAPPLVTACRDHLYRLQTVQNSTAGMTTGATQFLTLGTSHTSGLTSVPPNYPLLVAEFRELLGRIAQDEHDKGNRVVIAIDEVDRLGTDAQALAFLAEIKGILGVPHVHYLISVAEDVGAAFVRRGLPNRDVTDSSLDDVLHVMPGTLRESTDILKRRARGIGDAHIALAHALSGGIPRDLIRYGRRLLEVRTNREQSELHQVAHTLITEELSETLAGFRTLLAKQQWDRNTMGVLGSFRTLVAHLRATCPCPGPDRDMRLALTHFAAQEAAGVSDESRRLVDEAAAYAYFSLTLLDIFGRRDFTARRTVAAQHPDGRLNLLAEARQELGVSPCSARTLIDDIRKAWDLAPVTAQGSLPTVVIPAPRGTICNWHPRRW